MDSDLPDARIRRKSDLNLVPIQIAPPLLSEITHFIRMQEGTELPLGVGEITISIIF